MFHSLAGSNHAFHNGNKRTALVSTVVFLDRHNRRVTASDDELFEFVVRVARHDGEFNGSADENVEAIGKWIREHTEPVSSFG
jgi:death-on-curing family protein